MKKSKVMSLVVLLFLVLALTLIPSGNVSALGAGDFFLTDEELPSSCRIDTSFYKTWPGPSMGIRMKLMGGSWKGKVYTCGGMVTVCVGYYPTEEEAKKWMNPDVYIYKMDVYGGIGYQGTTLSEWALQSNEYQVHSFSSGTAYGDEGFTTHDITHKSYGDDKGAVIQKTTDNIFRIRNVIFHIVGTEGLLDPLVAEKARRLLGGVVEVKDQFTWSIIEPGSNFIIEPPDLLFGDTEKRVGIIGVPEANTFDKYTKMLDAGVSPERIFQVKRQDYLENEVYRHEVWENTLLYPENYLYSFAAVGGKCNYFLGCTLGGGEIASFFLDPIYAYADTRIEAINRNKTFDEAHELGMAAAKRKGYENIGWIAFSKFKHFSKKGQIAFNTAKEIFDYYVFDPLNTGQYEIPTIYGVPKIEPANVGMDPFYKNQPVWRPKNEY